MDLKLKILLRNIAWSVCCVNGASILDSKASAVDSYNQYYILSVLLSVACLVCLSVYALLQCGHCYNSEVSSTNHPACSTGMQSDGHKWGGSDNNYQSSTYGEVVNINDSSPSYAMYSTGVNTASGFQGYSMSSTPLYNPIRDSQEPPPAYSDVQ